MTMTKERLLSRLKEAGGNWISGEVISEELGISRSAIWKQIGKLREDGYLIESSSRKGYILRKVSDALLPGEIRQGLRTQIFGQREIVYFQETDSTNIQAKNLAAEGAGEGTLVIAEKQIAGKGRKGRVWFSPVGNGIYVSLIVRPTLPPAEAAKMMLMTAVAVAEAVVSVAPLNVRIKWPNDILVNEKKMAGILTEISTDMDAVDYMIIGLGLNVNTPAGEFPPEIRTLATSLRAETGRTFSRAAVLRAVLQSFETHYDRFMTAGFEPILEKWKAYADIIGRKIRVDMIGRSITGDVLEVDRDGVLVIQDDEGKIHKIVSGDVNLL